MSFKGMFATLALAFELSACAPRSPSVIRVVDASSGQAIALDPKAMAPGATFSGTYLSPHTGKMQLVERDRKLEGTYSSTIDDCNANGALAGRIVGNAAMIRWRELRSCGSGGTHRVRDISGEAQLLYDAPDGSGGPVRLFGFRSFVNDPGRKAPWTAVKVPAAPTIASMSEQVVDPAFDSSPEGMAVRVEAAGAALDAAAQESNAFPESLRLALSDARHALLQTRRAVRLWIQGDDRSFLEVQYCLGVRLLRVEAELAAGGYRPRPGLAHIVPDRPPSTWSDASCRLPR